MNRNWCDDDRAPLRPLHRDPREEANDGFGLGRELLKDILIAAGYVPVITPWSQPCQPTSWTRRATQAWFCDRRLVAIDRRRRLDDASEDDSYGESESEQPEADTDASAEEPGASDPSGKGMYI